MRAPPRARSSRPAGTAAVAFALLLAAIAAPAHAQQATLQITQGPYYAGFPIDLQIVADGFEEEPQPQITGDPPPGTTLAFVQSRPQVSSMVQIVNGRITQSRQVRFAYVYQLTAQAAGRYTLGPFTLTQDGKSAVTRSISVSVTEVPQARGQRLRVVLPDHPVFIGQRVPVTVEWWTEQGLAEKLYDEHLSVPLFLDTARFQFLDEQKEPSRVSIHVDVPGGTAEFPADVRRENRDGTDWVVRSFSRTLVPVTAGRVELGRPTLVCEEAIAFQRDLFGSRVPSRTRRVKVAAEPIVLDVQTVPAQGRPASFAGAIGQGFTVDVAADRTVLQTGDPVKLTITIHGDGSLDGASLPPLEAAGLSPDRFRLPDGEVAGFADDGGKRFEVTVRVLDPSVREIPPIEYSWFDPAAGRFDGTRSQPIALSVRAATMVGAGDVVSAEPPEATQEEKEETHADKAAPPAGAPAFTLTGADLSVETDLATLRSPATSLLGSPVFVWANYGAGILALAAGFLIRRRRSIDPVRARLARDMRALRARVARDAGAKDVADSLRRMASLRDDTATRPGGLDEVLRALDEMAYAPGGEQAGVPESLRRQALAAADAISEEAR